jgi:hypothetical protein
MNEIVICAAIKTRSGEIVRGHRHSDCIRTMVTMRLPKYRTDLDEQGFITSQNRFVGRVEGWHIQKSAGIESCKSGGYNSDKRLFSEDLY